MPELMIDFITSLEGYGAADGWPGLWGLDVPEYVAWVEDQPEADHTILMGANTYRLMLDLAADGEPGVDALADKRKIVFSSTLTEPLAWPNTQLVAHDAVSEAAADGRPCIDDSIVRSLVRRARLRARNGVKGQRHANHQTINPPLCGITFLNHSV